MANEVSSEIQVEREGVTLDDLKEKMATFAKERDWDQFHSPRNLLLAMVILLLLLPFRILLVPFKFDDQLV